MKYLIVGGVAGGATAAARIRRNTEKDEIILFEKGDHISYANCGLPYYVGGVIADRDRLFVQTPEAFGRRFRIDVRVRQEVTRVDPATRTVTVRRADGSTYTETYDKLLLSPGSSPVRPPLPGVESAGIFTLRNVEDTDRIKAYTERPDVRRAVVVGGGFIGLEMAENLRHAGLDVSVVEMADQVMGPIDYSMAAFVHDELTRHGVKLYLGEAVSRFDRDASGLTVTLQSGTQLRTDMVLLSIGVRPQTQLATDAGLTIGEARGIWVNEFLQTSDEHIYAVGDAIEFPHPLTGRPWLNFLAGPANRQARIVADNMVLGNRLRYEGAIGTSVAKVFDLTVASTGLPAKRLKQMGIPYLSATIHPASHAGYYPGALPMAIKVTFAPDSGKLYGAQIVGHDGVDKRIDEFALVLKNGGTVHDLTRVEQAYAPPFSSAKDPVAMASYVAGNILNGKMTPIYWRELAAGVPGATLVDVRTADEYALGHLDGAVNVPLDDLRERLGEIPADRPVVVYCGVGLRGYLASIILKANGYTDVRNLVGGLRTYETATRPVCHPEDVGASNASQAESAYSDGSPAPETASTLTLDACGLSCPGPIIKLKQSMEDMRPGERLTVRATDAGFPRDAEAWCRSTGNRFLHQKAEGGIYTVMLEKAAHSAKALTPVSPTPSANGKTFVMFSDDLDKALATFVLANGAAATGKPVTIFFTFWGLNVIKKEQKPRVAKDFFGAMFDKMLPANSRQLGLSKLNMGGMGARMMRLIMRRKHIDSLETLRQQALDAGVQFIACQMSMDVMGVRREELLDEVTLGGVATYMERAENANVNLFI